MVWWQTLLTSGIGAFVAAKLALDQFYRQRLWEKRLAIFTTVLEALHDKLRQVKWQLEVLEGEPDGGAEYVKRLKAASVEASHSLQKAAATAEILLPASAVVALRAYLERSFDMLDSSDFDVILNRDYDATEAAIVKLRAEAKADLLPAPLFARPKRFW